MIASHCQLGELKWQSAILMTSPVHDLIGQPEVCINCCTLSSLRPDNQSTCSLLVTGPSCV